MKNHLPAVTCWGFVVRWCWWYSAHFAENQSLAMLAPAPHYIVTYKRSWHTGEHWPLISAC